MKNFLLVLLVVVLVGGGLFWAVAVGPLKRFLPEASQQTVSGFLPDYFSGNRGASSVPTTQLPGSTSAQPQGPVWTFEGTDGTTIDVTPFTANATSTEVGQSSQSVSVPPTQNIDIAGTNEPLSAYILTYIASDKSFNIGLFKEPLKETRAAAEQEFLAKLKISEGEACRLKYVVVTPFWVSQFYGGRNLGFSFCPGAVQL